MIFVSPAVAAGAVGVGLPGFVCLVVLWTPPTGASVAGRPTPERRAPRPRRFDWRRFLRMSSSDWSSLPVDMVRLGLVMFGGVGWAGESGYRYLRADEAGMSLMAEFVVSVMALSCASAKGDAATGDGHAAGLTRGLGTGTCRSCGLGG